MPSPLRKVAATTLAFALLSCELTKVTSPDVQTITVNAPATSVAIGAAITVEAVLRDSQGRTLDRPITWSAGGPQVQVTGNGRTAVVRGVSSGTTTLRAEAEGFVSEPVTITVLNLSATVSSVSPQSATSGGAGFTLTVSGRDFVNGAVVTWNALDRPTTFVSATQVTAAIPASDLSVAGTHQVAVRNPGPGGGSANDLSFTVNNPTPVITSVTPFAVLVGSPAFTLTVTGRSFVNGAVIRWNGSNRTTTFGSSTTLTATIPASDVANAGAATVTVANPAPVAAPSNSVTVTIQPAGPDLVIAALSTAVVGTVGGTLQTSMTVINQGPLPSGAFRVGFYLSPDIDVTTADVFTNSICNYPAGLQVGGTNNCAGPVSIPATLTPGTYYLGAIADDQGAVSEMSETNNARASDPITITGGAAPIDLVVTALSAPATGTAGGSFAANTVSITVANQGSVAAGPFRVGLYFSADTIISTSDVFMTTVCNYPQGLAGATFNVCGSAISVLIPASLTPGTYYLGAIADDQGAVAETNEANNTRRSAAITISAPTVAPDLTIVSFTAPNSGTVGGALNGISLAVSNIGPAASGAFRVGFYFSTDATITTSDVYSGFSCPVGALGFGASFQCTGMVGIPSSLAPGTYWLGGIADDLGVISETNEANNARATGPITIVAPQEIEVVGMGAQGAGSTRNAHADLGGIRSP